MPSEMTSPGVWAKLRALLLHFAPFGSQSNTLRTKVRIYNSNVKSVFLYGWGVIESDMKKLNVFHNRCLRRICGTYWPNVISNKELYKKISSSSVVNRIKYQRLRWLAYVLRMDQQWIPKIALHWTPATMVSCYANYSRKRRFKLSAE